MELKIKYSEQTNEVVNYVLDKLPTEISVALAKQIKKEKISPINEIRIRSCSYITILSKNRLFTTEIYITERNIEEIIISICNGSVYAHLNTIKEGYIPVGNGVRAGICGRAVIENGEIQGVYNITSIIIRIPQRIPFAGDYLFSLLKSKDFYSSVLLYSPPGVGKTTILRHLASLLSLNTNIRFAIIDTREEIAAFLSKKELSGADVYISYPKGLAVELSTKSMNPQLILCDEISSFYDTNAVIKAVNSGVSFVATTHARSFEELTSKEIIKPFIHYKVFDYALGILRNERNRYDYTLTKLK